MATYRCTISDHYQQAVEALAPTNYWPLSETSGTNANDLGSGNDDGTIGGSPTMGTAVGHGGTGITFDGTNDQVALTGVAASGTTFTVAMWFKPNEAVGDSFMQLLWDGGASRGLRYRDDLNTLIWDALDNSDTALTDGVEYHVAVSVTSGSGTFYVNGVADGAIAGSVPTFTPTIISGSGGRIGGVLSDVSYWSGTALTDAQIAALYAARQARPTLGTLRIGAAANARNTLAMTVASTTATYWPTLSSEIVVYEDATRLFGGYLTVGRTAGYQRMGLTPLEHDLEAASFDGYAERRYVTETIAGGTLKSFLQTLDNYLTPYGVTLDAAQVNGPTLSAATYDTRLLKDVFDELALLSGYVWEIDASKTLRMFQPSATAAPFNLAAGDLSTVGDVEVAPSQTAYANKVYLKIGTPVVVEKTETFTGTGAQSAWVLTYPLVLSRGYITVNGVFETLGIGATWEYTAATNTITRTAAVTNGHSIVIIYDAQFPMTLTAEDTAEQTARGLYEVALSAPEVFDATVGQDLADQALAVRLLRPRTVRYTTLRTGDIKPGQTQTVTLPTRDLTGTWTLTDVLTEQVGLRTVRRITAVEGTTFTGTWRDRTTTAGGGKASGLAVVSAAPAPVPPQASLGLSPSYTVIDGTVLKLGYQASYTPSAGDTNALATTVFGPASSWWRLTPSADRTIHGIYCSDLTNGARGHVLVLYNDSSFTLTWGTGTVTNARKVLPPRGASSFVQAADETIIVVYDTNDLGWRIVGGTTDGRWTDGGALNIPELSATPSNPTSGGEWKIYAKGDKFILAFNDGGTMRYHSLDGTAGSGTWTHSTSAP